MKKLYVLVMLLSFAVISSTTYGQEKKSKKQRKVEKQQVQQDKIKQIVEAQNYVFVPDKISPYYDVRVTKEEVKAHLPYTGRVYSPPTDPSEGGIKFSTQDFEYKIENTQKGGWDIFIKTNDLQKTYDLTLKITSSGSASLFVKDPTRTSINFHGRIEEIK
ncbi:MAG: DUF4251 domain-containing protein [Bacteroidales bacterium]|jgi:hypothetical protein|nr:DUF4251 domain-containing protein [Bacteroidales bacterium]